MIYYVNNPPDLFTERVVRKAIRWYMHKYSEPELWYDITFVPNDARIVVSELVDGKKQKIEELMVMSKYNFVEAERPAVAYRVKE